LTFHIKLSNNCYSRSLQHNPCHPELNDNNINDSEKLIPSRILNIPDSDFNYWLAGIIEGDGTLIITKTKQCASFELILDAKDIQTLYFIKYWPLWAGT